MIGKGLYHLKNIGCDEKDAFRISQQWSLGKYCLFWGFGNFMKLLFMVSLNQTQNELSYSAFLRKSSGQEFRREQDQVRDQPGGTLNSKCKIWDKMIKMGRVGSQVTGLRNDAWRGLTQFRSNPKDAINKHFCIFRDRLPSPLFLFSYMLKGQRLAVNCQITPEW